MKSPLHAVCGTQCAWGLCVGSAAGWPPSSSLSVALSHAFLFICLLNGFGIGSHSLLCKQTVWIRLLCHGPTRAARVGRSGCRGLSPAEARSGSCSLAAEGIGAFGRPQLTALFPSSPPGVRGCARAGGSAPGGSGTRSPWQSYRQPGKAGDCRTARRHSPPRAWLITPVLSERCKLQALFGSV